MYNEDDVFADQSKTQALDQPRHYSPWLLVLVALAVGFFFQPVEIVPHVCACRCLIQVWEQIVANGSVLFDAIVLSRVALALVFRQAGGWKEWACFCMLSPIWIEGLYRAAFIVCQGPTDFSFLFDEPLA